MNWVHWSICRSAFGLGLVEKCALEAAATDLAARFPASSASMVCCIAPTATTSSTGGTSVPPLVPLIRRTLCAGTVASCCLHGVVQTTGQVSLDTFAGLRTAFEFAEADIRTNWGASPPRPAEKDVDDDDDVTSLRQDVAPDVTWYVTCVDHGGGVAHLKMTPELIDL
jgi:hypothetical protein